MTGRVLVIDDDAASCRLVRAALAPEGLEVVAAHDGASGIERAASERLDLVIVDLMLPESDGIEVLEKLRAAEPQRPIMMLTAHGDVKTAVRATQRGAFDFLAKPIDVEQLVIAVRRAIETRALKSEVEDLRRRLNGDRHLLQQMGPSPAVLEISDRVGTVARSTFSVLLLGETGTGKDLVAQEVHRQSDRRDRPFIAVDCGAIPETLLESELFGYERGAFTGAGARRPGQFHLAEGGTLFLDEIGNLPLPLQSKLLRVLESRQLHAVGATRATPMDVRFVAATNEDLEARANDGRFRADLYFRLAQFKIVLPPLRERRSDVSHLANRFLREASIELRKPLDQIAPDAIAFLETRPWPGNVRELRNLVRQAVLEAREAVVDRALLERLAGGAAAKPEEVELPRGRSLKEVAEAAARGAEHRMICQALRDAKGNKSQAARELRVDYKTLYLKMKSLGIVAKDFA